MAGGSPGALSLPNMDRLADTISAYKCGLNVVRVGGILVARQIVI